MRFFRELSELGLFLKQTCLLLTTLLYLFWKVMKISRAFQKYGLPLKAPDFLSKNFLTTNKTFPIFDAGSPSFLDQDSLKQKFSGHAQKA